MRAKDLIRLLQLAPHPEGGHYREIFRSQQPVQPADGRQARSALTTIDFVLQSGEFSAWHRVASDEVWHLLEGGPLRLWCMPPTLDSIVRVTLGPAGADTGPRHVVPAGWWQAAEPEGDFAYVGATVGPGFDFADFSFGREDAAFMQALARIEPDLLRLAGRTALAPSAGTHADPAHQCRSCPTGQPCRDRRPYAGSSDARSWCPHTTWRQRRPTGRRLE